MSERRKCDTQITLKNELRLSGIAEKRSQFSPQGYIVESRHLRSLNLQAAARLMIELDEVIA